jgi:hypothetical protein
MDYVTNDYGDDVICVGSPGSIARAECLYPKLIARLQYLLKNGKRNMVDKAIEEGGVHSKEATETLKEIVGY